MGGSSIVLLDKDREDAVSDLVADDSLIVFANNVDAKLLIKRGSLV